MTNYSLSFVGALLVAGCEVTRRRILEREWYSCFVVILGRAASQFSLRARSNDIYAAVV